MSIQHNKNCCRREPVAWINRNGNLVLPVQQCDRITDRLMIIRQNGTVGPCEIPRTAYLSGPTCEGATPVYPGESVTITF